MVSGYQLVEELARGGMGIVYRAEQRTPIRRNVATGMGQIIGTFDYMSPEQSRRGQQDVDTRSAIYSLGVLLYELLTGTPPFDRERLRSADLDEMLRIIRVEEPPRPSVRLAESRVEARAELPTQPIDRFRKFAKRNGTVLATTGPVTLALLLGIVGIAYQAVRASRAEATANIEAFEFLSENVLGTEGTRSTTGYSPDPNLKPLILLKNAEARVEERFADEPALAAKMKGTLASSIKSVGQFDHADRLYREYFEYLKTNRGPTDPDTIRVMRDLVRINVHENRLTEAETIGWMGSSVQRPDHMGNDEAVGLDVPASVTICRGGVCADQR